MSDEFGKAIDILDRIDDGYDQEGTLKYNPDRDILQFEDYF